MTMATNLLLILLAINLGFFVFGNTDVNSPILASFKVIYQISTGSGDWISFINSYASLSTLTIFGALITVVALGALATGANWITTGGGYGSMLSLQVLAIAIFLPLLLMPNFHPIGFPAIIETVLDVIFGGLITVTVISMLKGF